MRRGVVPADLRPRLEQARLDTLALLRALDHGLGPHPAPAARLVVLADADADCAEALWALEQPPGALDMAAMVRDTSATLTASRGSASRSATPSRAPPPITSRTSNATSARRSTLARPDRKSVV